MALDPNCEAAMEAAAGRPLTPQEKKKAENDAIALAMKIKTAANDPLAVENILGGFKKDRATARAINTREAALNYRAGVVKDAYRNSVDFAKTNPDEVARGMFVKSMKNYYGSKDSLGTVIGREIEGRIETYNADLIKNNLFDYAYGGKDNFNIWMARAGLSTGINPADLTSKYGANAVKIAQLFEKHQEAARVARNQAGAWINRAPDYVTGQKHDSYLLAKAGGHSFGSDASFQTWHSDIKNDVDWTKSFGGDLATVSDAAKQARLKSLHTQFVAGKHLQWSAKQDRFERELQFKTPEASYNYWKKYSGNTSVAESVWHDMSSAGRDIGLRREWGPDPQGNVEKFFDRWQKELNDKSDSAGLAKLEKVRKAVLDRYLPVLTDSAGHPDSSFASRYLAIGRQTLNAAKIAASLPSNMGDLVLRASQMQRQDQGFLGELAKSSGRMFEGMSANDRSTLAAEYGIRLQHAMTPIGNEYYEQAGVGKLAKMNQFIMKASGHSWWFNTMRTGSLAADGFRYHSMRGQAMDALPEGTRQVMQQFGITAKDWDVIRRSDPAELEGGRKILAPSQIRAMDASHFKDVAEAENPTETQLLRARDRVADKFRNMLGEMADRATSAPSRDMRAIIYGHVNAANPAIQELYRSFFGLKGFLGNYMREHLGGIALNDANPNNVGWTKAIGRTLVGANGGKSALQMYSLIAGGVGLGYLKDTLRDIADGKWPPENPVGEHWGDAMMRAFAFQSFGLMSDYILGQGQKPNADVWDKIGSLAGPELDTIGELVDELGHSLTHGYKKLTDSNYTMDDLYRDFGKDAAKFTSTVYHSTPGNDLLWTKFASDYGILDQLMDYMNPGYKQRLQQRLQARTGQRYVLSGQQ